MKLNQIPNFRVEDFPTEQAWISKLFIQLNSFVQNVNRVLSQNIDYDTNIKSVSKSYSQDIVSFQEFSFQWPYVEAPQSVIVSKAVVGSSKTPTILLAAWSYDPGTKAITISRITEVNAGSVAELSGNYQFTVRATI